MSRANHPLWRGRRVLESALVLALHLVLGWALLRTTGQVPSNKSSHDQARGPTIQWLMPMHAAISPVPKPIEPGQSRASKLVRYADARRRIAPVIHVPLALPVERENEARPAPPNPSPVDAPQRQLDPATLVRDLHLADAAAESPEKKNVWKGPAVPALEAKLAAGIERAHDARAIGFGMAKVTEITSASDGTMRVYKITTPLGSYCAYYRRDGGRPTFGICPQ